MHQPGNYDYASSYYQQHDQSQFQNPNPNPNPNPYPHDPYSNSLPMITHASAPPISPTTSFDSQNHDHSPFQNLTSSVPNPNSSSYYPNLDRPSSYYSYDQNQTYLHSDRPLNSSHDGFSMPVPYSSEYNPSGGLNESFGRDDMRYDNRVGFREGVGGDDGVYAYKGSSSVEPYGARGTGSQSVEPYGARGTDSQSAEPYGARGTGSQSAEPYGARGTGSQSVEPYGARGTGSQSVEPYGARGTGSQSVEPYGARGTGSQSVDPYGARGTGSQSVDPYGARGMGSQSVDPYGARGTGSQSVEPYGARGTRLQLQSSGALAFDDYGRPIRNSNGKDQVGSFGSPGDVTKAIPKSEMQQDVHSGVQKFRVTLLAETGGQRNMDVLCQVGLDGIRMLEHSTSRTLQIYSLETLIKCEVLDSSIFAFWSKTSVDIEPKRIRLKSNSYTTNIILDAVTAATIQLKEMDGVNKPSHPTNVSDQIAEKKKGLGDWINLMKPKDEEKDHWVPDDVVKKCNACGTDFGAFMRRHHCRNCGDIFCDKCTQGRITLTADEQARPVRVCDQCMAEVTQRLSNSRAPGQVAGLHRHEDLAKKLQEEMDRKRQTSSGSKYDGSRLKMRDVACPTCTVHLEVEVPSSGSKTIECSVCQHPFLVNAQ